MIQWNWQALANNLLGYVVVVGLYATAWVVAIAKGKVSPLSGKSFKELAEKLDERY